MGMVFLRIGVDGEGGDETDDGDQQTGSFVGDLLNVMEVPKWK